MASAADLAGQGRPAALGGQTDESLSCRAAVRASRARLDRLTAAIAEAVGCRRPLFVPCDQGVAWSWLPLETRTVVPWDVLRKIVDDYDPTAGVAVGDAVPGLNGFRQTHRQALRAQDVAVFARPGTRVTFFSDVGPVA